MYLAVMGIADKMSGELEQASRLDTVYVVSLPTQPFTANCLHVPSMGLSMANNSPKLFFFSFFPMPVAKSTKFSLYTSDSATS